MMFEEEKKMREVQDDEDDFVDKITKVVISGLWGTTLRLYR